MRSNIIKNAKDLILDMEKNFEEIGKHSKLQNNAFRNFLDEIFKNSDLDAKTKALISIALSIQKQCKWCITYSVNLAIKNQATKEEIFESGWMGVAFGGFSAYTYMQILEKSFSDLSK